MGRKSLSTKLNLYIQGNLIGHYVRSPSGATSFNYTQSWVDHGFQISQSLPLVTTPYSGSSVATYFENLLPDLLEVRRSIASKVGAKSADHFDLLNSIGDDCIGSLRFIEEGSEQNPNDLSPEMRALSDKAIAKKIRNLKSEPLGLEREIGGFRISLAGVQEKMALLYWKGKWSLPLGATPTTHIIKPPMKFETGGLDMSTSVHNEYFCMKLCKAFGLPTAEVDIIDFNGKIVLSVERFDRYVKNGIIYRKTQEDMCQALGYFSNQKYQCDGGPNIEGLIKVFSTSINRKEDLKNFFKSLVVYFVLGGIDGHAKNYSISYGKDGHQMTPMYDVLSIFPALSEKDIKVGKFNMALSVGGRGHYLVKKIARRHFLETAKMCQLSIEVANTVIDEVLECISSEVWNETQLSPLFDKNIKNKIINGLKIISKKIN